VKRRKKTNLLGLSLQEAEELELELELEIQLLLETVRRDQFPLAKFLSLKRLIEYAVKRKKRVMWKGGDSKCGV
jgi:hypothetical protein